MGTISGEEMSANCHASVNSGAGDGGVAVRMGGSLLSVCVDWFFKNLKSVVIFRVAY